jgi:hypothetical protein
MNELTHYIGGKHVKGQSGRFADVMNPATGEVQAKVPLASSEEMAQAVAIAAKAQPGMGCHQPAKARPGSDEIRSSFCTATWTSWQKRCRASMARPFRTPRAT